jgi:hypothetical protein
MPDDAQNVTSVPIHERGRYPRVKTTIPRELRCSGNPAPLRTQTDEISLVGATSRLCSRWTLVPCLS